MNVWRHSLKPARGAIFGLTAVAACWSAQQTEQLLTPAWSLALLALGVALLLPSVVRAKPWPALLAVSAVFAIFFANAQWRANSAMAERIAADDEARTVEVLGYIEDLPVRFEHGVRFGLRVQTCLSEMASCHAGVLYRLSWYFGRKSADRKQADALRPGARLRLQLRLKQVHAPSNPGLFDAELRSLEDGVSARGYVRALARATPEQLTLYERMLAPMVVIHQARFWLRDAMNRALTTASALSRAVLVALVVGDQSAIPGTAWEMFNRTGIGHLISISGLHITMLAGFANALLAKLWRAKWLYRTTGLVLPAWLPTPIASKLAAVLVAFGYSALAGWGIPAQRTCWMLSFALLASLSNRASQPLSIVAAALLAVLLIDPWAVLAAGFWLSFAAVAAIVWFGSGQVELAAKRPRLSGLIAAARAQWAVTVALVPLGAMFFSSISIISPIANSVAIPVVSFIVTPLALIGAPAAACWPWLGKLLLSLAAHCFESLTGLMQWLDRIEFSVWTVPSPEPWSLAVAVLGIVVLLSKVLPGRWLGALCLLPIITKPAQTPAAGEVWVTALDVGQGMAVLVETAKGRLLYDAGPEYGPDSDAGQKVVAPYLRSRGIDRLELLAISHKDSDHSGGGASVLRTLKVDRLVSSMAEDDSLHEQARTKQVPVARCQRGEQWLWGEVGFEWLHPGPERSVAERSKSNAQSCVLKVTAPAGTVLLAGDIEAAQERRLLEAYPDDGLRADVLLVPHHGSKTSSSSAFLQAVAPKYAIFQLGYRNRFRHPHPNVWSRYLNSDAVLLRSDWHGAVQVRLKLDDSAQVLRHRIDSRRYWRVCVDPNFCPTL